MCELAGLINEIVSIILCIFKMLLPVSSIYEYIKKQIIEMMFSIFVEQVRRPA